MPRMPGYINTASIINNVVEILPPKERISSAAIANGHKVIPQKNICINGVMMNLSNPGMLIQDGEKISLSATEILRPVVKSDQAGRFVCNISLQCPH